MKVAIHQPNYLPWCGYFAKALAADLFIILDDAAMSNGRTYVSRTKIRSGEESRWLTVPTAVRGNPPIREVKFADSAWPTKHLASLRHTYRNAPCFDEVMDLLEPAYANAGEMLAEFNFALIRRIVDYLGLTTEFRQSSDFAVETTSDDRLIDLVRKSGGSCYLSGKGGTNYQDPAKFAAAGIGLDVRVYDPVPYEAKGFPFIPGLSIVDCMFVMGRRAAGLLRYE